MNRTEAKAELLKLPCIAATCMDGEWRITIKPALIRARSPGGSQSWARNKAEAMACYTDDNADAVGTAQQMAARWQAQA